MRPFSDLEQNLLQYIAFTRPFLPFGGGDIRANQTKSRVRPSFTLCVLGSTSCLIYTEHAALSQCLAKPLSRVGTSSNRLSPHHADARFASSILLHALQARVSPTYLTEHRNTAITCGVPKTQIPLDSCMTYADPLKQPKTYILTV
jgi:hypothetical protein